MRELSLAQARRIALAAQGFGRARPQRLVTMRDLQAQIDQLAQFQIDSINILARAHQMPLFSRLGPYDTALLERAGSHAPRRLFEYWGHAASLIDVRLEPALRFRMSRAAEEAWGGMRRVHDEHPELVACVLGEVRRRGPATARQIEADEQRVREHWGWNWSATKSALEWHFWSGAITSAGRTAAFERRYDLPERVLPRAVVETPTPGVAESHVELVRRAALALGIGTERCLADYFRLTRTETCQAIATLVALGELEPVGVAGWTSHAFRHIGPGSRTSIPRAIRTRALISPFDSLIFERTRARELFGLDYTIEIYVPEAKRRHGYYVYPFLLDEHFEARVDLKADRGTGRLLVRATWREDGGVADDSRVATELLAELHLLAGWLGLGEVVVEDRGDFATALRGAAARPTP